MKVIMYTNSIKRFYRCIMQGELLCNKLRNCYFVVDMTRR